jgi:hypothetical protein
VKPWRLFYITCAIAKENVFRVGAERGFVDRRFTSGFSDVLINWRLYNWFLTVGIARTIAQKLVPSVLNISA